MSQFTIFYASPIIFDERGSEHHIIVMEAPDFLTLQYGLAKFMFENMLAPSAAMIIIPNDMLREMNEAEQHTVWEKQVSEMCQTGGFRFTRVEDLTDD